MSEAYNNPGQLTTATISCPKCNNAISYYNRNKSACFACPQCFAFFDTQDHNKTVLRTFNEEDQCLSPLPMGTHGMVDGKEYTLVGFIQKKEVGEDVYWNEYLFSATGESWYLILAEYNGHWMMIQRSEKQHFEVQHFESGYENVYDDGKTYPLFLSYKFTVVAAQGEFDWNVLDDEELTTNEYVCAPDILVCEDRNGKLDWFRSRYISPGEILRLFNVAPENLADRGGWVPFDPAKFYPSWRPLFKFTALMFCFMLLISMFSYFVKPSKQIYANAFQCRPDTTSMVNCLPIITPPFEINGPAPVQFDLSAIQLENSWIDLPMVLVNENDGKAYEINKAIEFYHGYDDGESWSEGSREESATISSVPSGTYHINIYPSTESTDITNTSRTSSSDTSSHYNSDRDPLNLAYVGRSFDVVVTQNVFMVSNFMVIILVLLIYPSIQYVRKYRFENSKWFKEEYGNLTKD